MRNPAALSPQHTLPPFLRSSDRIGQVQAMPSANPMPKPKLPAGLPALGMWPIWQPRYEANDRRHHPPGDRHQRPSAVHTRRAHFFHTGHRLGIWGRRHPYDCRRVHDCVSFLLIFDNLKIGKMHSTGCDVCHINETIPARFVLQLVRPDRNRANALLQD